MLKADFIILWLHIAPTFKTPIEPKFQMFVRDVHHRMVASTTAQKVGSKQEKFFNSVLLPIFT